MFTVHKKMGSMVFIMFTSLVMVVGCGAKCQPPVTTPFTTFIDQEWRVVESSNPQVAKDLSNVNFITMTFKINFTGAVNKVENNDKLNQAALTFIYNVDVDQKLIKLQYSSTAAASQDGSAGAVTPVGSVVTYHYELKTDFKLTEQGTGYTYRMVPFTGVVRPDQKCTF